MKIEVRFRGLEASDSLSAYAVRRAHMQFSRFNTAIHSVVVRIGDINGPRGGADKRCHVTLRGPALGTLTLEDLSADAYSAVDMVLDRAARAAGRELERARTTRRENLDARRAP